jgi:hypothetical protein
MIVSSQIGVIDAKPLSRRRRIAVGRSVPGSDVVSEQPMQKPNFNVSRWIAKPFIAEPYLRGDGRVPLKCNQYGSHVEGAALFDAPIYLVDAPLDVPKDRLTYHRMDDMTEDVKVPFEEPLDYKAGIRPSIRRLKETAIYEPVYPFPGRPVGPVARPTIQKTTYDDGKLALEVLGRRLV